MLNLFRHPIESNSYETLNQVQGDKIIITIQSTGGEEKGEGGSFEGEYEEPKRSDLDRIDYRYGHHRHWSDINGSRPQLLDTHLSTKKHHPRYRFNNEDCTDEGDFK